MKKDLLQLKELLRFVLRLQINKLLVGMSGIFGIGVGWGWWNLVRIW